MKLHTHYDNLKITPDATPTEIKRAYRKLCSQHHPDKYPSEEKAQQERILKMINKAYDVLSDPTRRAIHDKWIKQTQLEGMSWEQRDDNYYDNQSSQPENDVTEFVKRKTVTLLGLVGAITLGLLFGAVMIYFNSKQDSVYRPHNAIEHHRVNNDNHR